MKGEKRTQPKGALANMGRNEDIPGKRVCPNGGRVTEQREKVVGFSGYEAETSLYTLCKAKDKVAIFLQRQRIVWNTTNELDF